MTHKKFHQNLLTKGREIALLSAILLIISTFLTWGQTKMTSVIGINGDGKYIIGIGIFAFILLFFRYIPKILAYLFALALLALAGYYFIYRGMLMGAKPWISALFLADFLAIVILILRRKSIFVSLALGINALALGLINYLVMFLKLQSIEGGMIGNGLTLAVIASFGIVVGTVIEGFQERNKTVSKKLFFFDQSD